MALITKAPRGTQDIIPAESYKYRYIERVLSETAANFGFSEIRTPVFEHTELFNRSVGETTDVVQKEMYTFTDNGGRSVSLRPEGTAGAARAFIEHGLFNEPLPQKLFYITSCYRYEKPQAGRLREFHQFGVESLGSGEPAADAEIISLAKGAFDYFGIDNIKLEINSIGCPVCRAKYHEALHSYFDSCKEELCETCRGRLDRNPMRILDCKSPICQSIAKDSPVILDYLCDDCRDHFEAVKKYLDIIGIDYNVNSRIVRGLDYYTRTVFEFVSNEIGAQGTVCGGGRYDGLIGELGGNSLPACGFGLGLERILLVMEAQHIAIPEPEKCSLYIAPTSREYTFEAMRLINDLRNEGIHALTDVAGRSLKAQMKYANKIGAEYTMVLGPDEIVSHKSTVKRMSDGNETEILLDDFTDNFERLAINDSLSEFGGDINDIMLFNKGEK